MQDDEFKKAELLELIRGELEKLICDDAISEEEKLARIRKAQDFFERGVWDAE